MVIIIITIIKSDYIKIVVYITNMIITLKLKSFSFLPSYSTTITTD